MPAPATTAIVLAFLLATPKAPAPPPPPSQSHSASQPPSGVELFPLTPFVSTALGELTGRVSTERLLATITSLPPRRSAGPTAEHAARLVATQELLEKELAALGVKFTTQPVPLRRGLGADGAVSKPETKLKKSKTSDPTPQAPADPAANPAAPPPPPPPDSAPSAAEPTSPQWLNFIIDLPGENLPREILLLSAHFDSVPDAPGADDDGSGTAAILEMARLIKTTRHERTIRLCLFNHEEIGCVGSSHYAKVWNEQNKSRAPAEREIIVGMVSMDMIGYFSDAPDSQRNPFQGVPGITSATVGDFLALCGSSKHHAFNARFCSAMLTSASELKAVLIDLFPNQQMAFIPPDLLRSDHAPFLNLGVPALMLTDTSNFRNPHYHQPTDAIATLDQVRLTAGVRAITGAAWLMAGPITNREAQRERGEHK